MQLTLVVADFHTEREVLAAGAQQLPALAGLETVLRYGHRRRGDEEWRAWLARYLGRADLASAAPAQVARAALEAADPPAGEFCFATPVHLLAGINHVRLHPAGLLRLDVAEAELLVRSFAAAFGASGWRLHPVAGGLLLGGLPGAAPAAGSDPARWLGANIAAAMTPGAATPALLRATAEIEMWLHDHPVNRLRSRRGALTVNSLWLWGGARSSTGAGPSGASVSGVRPDAPVLVHGEDAFVAGLCRLCGLAAPRPSPDFAALAVEQDVEHLVVCSAAASGPRDAPLLRIDRDWLQPAVMALRSGTLARLRVQVAGLEVLLGRRALRRFWRRPLPWWRMLLRA